MGLFLDAVRGGIAGAAGTWLMDQVTTTMLEAMPAELREQEEAARPNGKSSVENLLDRVESYGFAIPPEGRPLAAQAVHYGLGVVPGAVYGVLHGRVPGVGRLRGLGYGAMLWALNDELLNSRMGFSAPPDEYPSETHMRGLVGHLVLGATTDTVIDVLGG